MEAAICGIPAAFTGFSCSKVLRNVELMGFLVSLQCHPAAGVFEFPLFQQQ